MLNRLLTIALELLVLILAPPLLPGIINKTKAWFAGRNGPPVLQVYYDLRRLWGKGMVISNTTTWLFVTAPWMALGAILLAGLMVPLWPTAAPVNFTGDLILFVYLLALARFFTTLAALDTGSSFEGMGVAREIAFAVFSEPALFLVLLVLVKIVGSGGETGPAGLLTQLNLSSLLFPAGHGFISSRAMASLVLAAMGLFVILLAECSRIPVDDPNTHLELTMIHEVMILDNSGPLLAAQIYATCVKMLIIATILIHILVPLDRGLNGQYMNLWIIMLCGLPIIAVVVGIVESMMARLRMKLVPTLLVGACLLGAFGFLLLIG